MSKLDWSNVDFETMIIHAGQGHDPAHGALATPIYQTSTFCFETVEEGADKFAKKIPGYQYTRGGNPTTRAFELKCAAMEGGEDAVATASGMGAVGSVMIAFLKCGDHVIFDNSVYGGTNAVATVNLPNMGVEVSRVDTSDLEALKAAIKPNTKMIYFETPNNPMIKVTDVAAVKAVAGKDIRVVVDATFGTASHSARAEAGRGRGPAQHHQVHQRPRRCAGRRCGRLRCRYGSDPRQRHDEDQWLPALSLQQLSGTAGHEDPGAAY